MIIHKCYGLKFGETVKLYFGNKVVAHKKIDKNHNELEVATELISRYRNTGAYHKWLNLIRIVENINIPLYKLKTYKTFNEFNQSSYAVYLDELKEKISDLSLNDIWSYRVCR